MTEPLTVLVEGEGYAPFLTAALFARFGPAPSFVCVRSKDADRAGDVVIHPSAFRWLHALGLSPQHLARAGGQPLSSWGGAAEIPFTENGQRTNGITLPAPSYAALLQKTCMDAGLASDPSGAALTVSTDRETAAEVQAAIPEGLHRDLEHLAVMEAARSMAFAVPGGLPRPAEIQELQRLAVRSQSAIMDMTAVLEGQGQGARVQHRREVWQALGRICPYDDDPFDPSEWRAAMSHAYGAPTRRPLVQTLRGRAHG